MIRWKKIYGRAPVDYYIKSLVIIALMFIFYHWWTRHVRMADLTQNLRAVLRELHDDVYNSEFRKDHRGVEVIELRNPTTRIVFTDYAFREELTANRFFKDSERSGANIAYISRHTVGGGNARDVGWWRVNHLHGRLFYSVSGVARSATVHDLVDQIIKKVREHAAQTNTTTPT